MNKIRTLHPDRTRISKTADAGTRLSHRQHQTQFYAQAKRSCRDLFQIRPAYYWIDFLASSVTAYIAASV